MQEYKVSNLLLPCLLTCKSSTLIATVVNHSSFFVSLDDLKTCFRWSFDKNHLQEIKTLLHSAGVQLYFNSYTHETQQELIKLIVSGITSIQDPKTQKTYCSTLFEVILSKRPYNKALVLALADIKDNGKLNE